MEPIWKTKEYKEISISPIFDTKWSIPKSDLGYNLRINSLRNCIDTINPDIWKKVRWSINNYDFVVEEPIINRAFYKYWEIVHTFNLLEKHSISPKVLCLAEAPGGFIQGTNYYYTKKIKEMRGKKEIGEDGFIKRVKAINLPQITSMSLNKSHPLYKAYNLPSYNIGITKHNVKILYGEDDTGDICNPKNFKLLKEMFTGSAGKTDFITADGGFDEGNDFNNKEQLHYPLFLVEITYALHLLNRDGNFLIKFFDTFTETSLDLLWLLASSFKEFSIYKPYTSRPTNSEKYIICKGYLGVTDSVLQTLENLLEKLYTLKTGSGDKGSYLSFRLFSDNDIPVLFRGTICKVNEAILEGQCHFLQRAINLSTNSDFIFNFDKIKDSTIRERNHKFREWKEKFKF
jgi:23S rRNA U2552 (ribose-2'-O)-methylase RlmE/FtsJ